MERLAAFCLCALLNGCASTEFNPAPNSPGYPAHKGEVRVLQSFPQEGSYDSVGIVFAYGVDRTTKETMVESLKEEAAKHGANAVVLQGDIKLRSRGKSREKVLGAYALKLKP